MVLKVIKIFEYINYRQYLSDLFQEKKRINPGFSHRVLSKKLGLSTSNYVLLIMQGKRNLNHDLRYRMSTTFGHSRKESEYFELMVNFAHAKTDSEKNYYYSKMISIRKSLRIQVLDDNQYEYMSTWYNPVIRELVTHSDWNGDYSLLANAVRPAITTSQARRSVELLLKCGLIEKRDGKYVQSSPVITTVQSDVSPLAITKFHREMCKRALEVLDSSDRENRNITGSTLHISRKTFKMIQEEITQCRMRILEMAQADIDADKVYHINFHMFPVSSPIQKNGK
jgi:uncharacterized protein (TIGR02147 family)